MTWTTSLPGRATLEGTAAYARRHEDTTGRGHFQEVAGLHVASVGLGTYLGAPDDSTDAAYTEAIARAVALGCNLVDTAINYRHQRSEQAVGAAIRECLARRIATRNEVLICTKAGYIPMDASESHDHGQPLRPHHAAPGTPSPEDIVGNGHCIAPDFLRDQIARSRANLGIETIDVLYLHNPEEQLHAIDRQTFLQRLGQAFHTLEQLCRDGHIGCYGLATWNAFREPATHRQYLALPEVIELARAAGGEEHRLRFIQLPVNLVMLEAFLLANQQVDGRSCTLVEAAARYGIHVVASAPLLQGRLVGRLPQRLRSVFDMLDSDAQRAVQLVRSLPGIGSVLVGMSKTEHVEQNLGITRLPRTRHAVAHLFRPPGG